MNYLEKNRNFSNSIFTRIIVILVSVFILLQIFMPHIIPAIITSIAVPFWRMEFSIESGSLRTIQSLIEENELLKRKIENNNIRLSTVDFVENENNNLKSILGLTSSTSLILAPIINRPPFFFYDELIIDAGLDKGISTSSLVFSIGNIPIGKIVDVGKDVSKVILFSSSGEKLDVLIGDDNIPAVAIGRGGGKYEVKLPQGLKVKEGDYVISMLNHSRPIGKVVFIDSSSIFQKVNFISPVNIYQMRWVLVSTDKK